MPVARIVFAGLLLAMAAGQALSFDAFAEAIGSYRLAGARGSKLMAYVLLGGEAAAGIGLATGLPRFRVAAGGTGLAVAIVWAGLAIQAFARGLTIPNCGCFGRFLAQELSWWILVQDAYFVLLAGLAFRSAWRDDPGRGTAPRPARAERMQSR